MVQHPIQPGELFTYRFKLPDAGTFWYHPHSNEAVQLERGLYGVLPPPFFRGRLGPT
jgi:FtsP/CotA-like multicopper oxidase with cupredoxin domain